MKCRFKEHGVPIPWFSLLSSADDLKVSLGEHSTLVIKPVDRSGARGVFRITADSDYRRLFDESLALSFCGQVLAEAYIPGLQISTETVMYQGLAHTPSFADRNYEKIDVYAPNIIENGGWVPSCVTSELRAKVEALVERAALALGVTDGIAKGDVVVGPKGPMMIEMAARPSGGDFSESLVPLGCGVNLIEAGINIAIGRTPDLQKLKPKWQRGVVNRYFFPEPGVLKEIRGIEEVRAQLWLRKLEFWYQPGDVVPLVQSHADRFGVFIVEGADRTETEARAAWVYQKVQIVTE
jgi:biotin carboxylase